MARYYFKQTSWSGGLAESVLQGGEGTLAEGIGLNIHETPGVLKVSQALAKESGTTVVDFPQFAINCSDGNSYWFGDGGNIYKRTSAGAWSLVHTIAGTPAILGACEFDDYIYYATDTALCRQSVANASSESPWSSEDDAWQTLNSATWHPMAVSGLYLCVGNDTQIATVDDTGTFTANGTPDVTLADVPLGHQICSMTNFGADILVGTKITTTIGSCYILRWDLASPAYVSADEVPGENAINCFLMTDNYTFAQAGAKGQIYYYNGETLEKAKKIIGDYDNKTMACLPGSTCNFKGIAMFGVSNLSSNPCNQGVYSYGQYDRNYPMALMLEYVISQDKIASISLGALIARGETLLVAWKDGTTYGVDAIDWSNKYASAYLKTLTIGGERYLKKTFEEYVISYKSLPTGTSVSLSYYPNYNSSDTAITLTDESDYYKYVAIQHFEAGTAQFKMTFTTSSDDAPEVEEFFVQWNAQEVL